MNYSILLSTTISIQEINSTFPCYISTDLREDFCMQGIPVEITERLYIDSQWLNVSRVLKFNDITNIIFLPESLPNQEPKGALNIISVFNQLVTLNFIVVCEEEEIDLLKNYSNQNIQFKSRTKTSNEKLELNAHIIITHGSAAVHFLKQQIPVIIAGPYGLGGWVTPQNFYHLIKNGFLGRAGGTFGEIIPTELVAHEILAIKECKNIESILFETKGLADNLPYRPLSEANNIIENYKHKEEQWRHLQYRWNIKPFIASNILFKEAGNMIMLTRKYIHDTLCTISKEDLPFLQQMNGKVTCEALWNNSQLEENEFWEMMYSLNEQRIILY